MTREAAADALMRIIAEEHFAGNFHDVAGMLMQPRPYGQPIANWDAISAWYGTLGPREREHIAFLIQEGLIAGLHSMLVLLDGGTGAPIIDNKYVQLKLSIELYKEQDGWEDGDRPTQTILLAPTERGNDLHDLFMGHVDEVRPTLLPAGG